jgi:hypothetical protein
MTQQLLNLPIPEPIVEMGLPSDLQIQQEPQKWLKLYEAQVEIEPENSALYLRLGLLYLLTGQEEQAQTTWFYIFSQVDDANSFLLAELTALLESTAQYFNQIEDAAQGGKIRNYLYEINPACINNVLL